VLRSWSEGDTTRNTSTTNFNGRELAEYALTRFQTLKLQQRELLGGSAGATGSLGQGER
jgi:hypothetical protein